MAPDNKVNSGECVMAPDNTRQLVFIEIDFAFYYQQMSSYYHCAKHNQGASNSYHKG